MSNGTILGSLVNDEIARRLEPDLLKHWQQHNAKTRITYVEAHRWFPEERQAVKDAIVAVALRVPYRQFTANVHCELPGLAYAIDEQCTLEAPDIDGAMLMVMETPTALPYAIYGKAAVTYVTHRGLNYMVRGARAGMWADLMDSTRTFKDFMNLQRNSRTALWPFKWRLDGIPEEPLRRYTEYAVDRWASDFKLNEKVSWE